MRLSQTTSFAALCTSTLLLLASGCGGGSSAPGTGPTQPTGGGTTSPANSVYLFQDNDAFSPPQPSSILQFSKTSTGSVTPISTIIGPANVIFESITEDPAGNLYVGANLYNPSTTGATGPGTIDIYEYSASSTGVATPIRTISGSATGLQLLSNNYISGLDLDSTGNLYIAAPVAFGSGPTGTILSGISVFSPSANGNVAPIRVIGGPLTTLIGSPSQIAVTPTGTVYVPTTPVVSAASVAIFGPTALGNVAPTSTLGGSATGIYSVKGIALDAAGNIYVASQSAPGPAPTYTTTPSVLVFAAGASGNIAPIRTISGSSTNLFNISNLRVDSAGEVFILSGTTLLKFAAGATGNVAPTTALTSAAYFQPLGSVAVQ